MPSWAGTDMVTIWVLTRVSRSIRSGRRKVRPGWRTLVRSRPYRNTTPRSYCRTVCTEVASASAAVATTARMTTAHKKVISSTPLRFRGPTHDPARHVRGEGIFVGHPSGQTGAPAPGAGLGPPELAQGGVRGRDRLGPARRPGRCRGRGPRVQRQEATWGQRG